MVASFVVSKVGESQGWDPRMTAIASAAAGGFSGLAYGAASAAGSATPGIINAGNTAAHAATKAYGMGSAINAGKFAGIAPSIAAKGAFAGGAAYTPGAPTTFAQEFGNQIDAFKEGGKAEQLGAYALKTLMQEPANQAPSGGGGGGGGSAPAYQGGGGGQYQTVWSFGQPNQGYKPQGI